MTLTRSWRRGATADPAGDTGHAPRANGWSGRRIAGIGAVLILAIVVISCFAVWSLREAALRDARVAIATKGVAIAEQTTRAVQAVDLVLRELQDKVGGMAAGAALRDNAYLTSRQFQIDISGGPRNLPQVDGLSVIDPDGRLIAFSRGWPAPPISLADRDLYLHLRDHDDPETFVSRPVRNRAVGTWTFFLARRVNGPGHRFAGIVVATLPLAYFEDFYKAVTDADAGAISLMRRDGILLARYPAMLAEVGTPFPPYPQWPRLVAAGGGAYDSAGTGTLAPRLVSVHPLQLYPLVVDVAIARESVLAHWRRSALFIAIATVVAALGLALLFRLLAAQVRALERQRRDLIATAGALSRSERRLQESARDLDLTLASMDAGVIMVNAEQHVVVCNARAAELLGLPPDLMASRPPFEQVLRHQWESNEFSRAETSLLDFIRAGGLADSPRVYERSRPDGRTLEIRTTALTGGGVVRTYADITERRAAEALRAARDAADRASRAKSEFLATMSHEIRSPMSGLLGVLELLRATDLDAEQARMAEMIQHSGAMLLAVLNDILDFSKIEAGALAIVPETIDARELLGDVTRPHAAAAARKGLAVTLSIAPDVPDRIDTDPLRLRQIVGNLLSNAIKFTAAGAVAVHADRLPDAAGAMLRVRVRDTGIGMSEAVMARLFNPFTQADGSTTRDFGGTGLGLSISQKLARLMGGDISVASRVGGGSVFTLTLPPRPRAPSAAPADGGPADATTADATTADATTADATIGDAAPAAACPTTTPAGAQAGDSQAGDSQVGGAKILVVDDDDTIRWLSRRQLESLGHAVTVAGDGAAALERVRPGAFDLVLTDCHMPRLDGVALTRAIRAHADPSVRAVPVIGLTADVTDTQRRRCVDAGMTELAIKPLTLERLARLLARHLPAPDALFHPAPGDMSAPAPCPGAFDDGVFLEIFEPGDPAGADWLNSALRAARADVEALRRGLTGPASGASTREAKAIAHRLAGRAFAMGAMPLGEAARALERAAASDAPVSARADTHAAIRDALDAAETAVAAFLAEAPGNAPGSVMIPENAAG